MQYRLLSESPARRLPLMHHLLLVALVALVAVFCNLADMVQGAPLPINCQVVRAAYTTRNIQLNNTAQVVSLAVYQGTAFFVDCFGYAVQSDSCDGSGGGPPAVVEAWVLTTAVGTRKELSRHPLSGDLLGASILSTSYYYGASRYIYLQMKATSLPAGCSTVVVQYSFSAYSSVAQPPKYQGGGFSSPFVAALSPPIIVRSSLSSLYLRMEATEDGGVGPPQTFQLGYTSLLRPGFCSTATSQGSVAYVRRSGLAVDGAAGVGTLSNETHAYLEWNVTFSAIGYVMLCLRPNPSVPFQYLGVLNVWVSNPSYFQIGSLKLGDPIRLNNPYRLTFVGQGFDLRSGKDSAKFASLLSLTCSNGRPAGGVPQATTLAPAGVVGSSVAYWDISLTIPGAFFVCYLRGTSWVSVPYYEPVAVNSRSLVANISEAIDGPNDDVPVTWRSRTRTRSLSLALPPPKPTTTTTTTTTTSAPPASTEPTGTSAFTTTTTTMPLTTVLVITSTTATVIPSTETTTLSSTTTTLGPILTTTTTTAVPPTTTSTSTTTAPTSTPAPTTVAPSTTSAPPSCDPLQLPAECPLLSDVGNALHLVLTVQYRVATFQSDVWRGNLSSVLCVPLERVAIYEMADDGDSTTTASLVIGLLCTATDGGFPVCSASELLSAVSCIASNVVITTDPVANATYQAQRDMLRASPLRILAVRDATSSITTANTTNHAAPSENPVLDEKDIAIVSSTVVIAVCGSLGGVALIVLIRKRNFVRRQLGRLNPGEVFRRTIVRVAQTNDLDDLEKFALGDNGPDGGHATLEYPLLNQEEASDYRVVEDDDLVDTIHQNPLPSLSRR